MALSWNEIRQRSISFSKKWEDETRERAEKDTFWNEFFEVFGKSRKSLAVYEKQIQNLKGNTGFIDLFWKGTLLVEHKSRGKDLDAALEQALDYCHGLSEEELPKYILVSDFEKFKLWDLEENSKYEFNLNELHKNIRLFGFIAGYKKREYKEEDPVNVKAAELMGKLHDQLEDIGYTGHSLEVFLVRLLFCLFADDTGIFERDSFKELIESKSKLDGSDLGSLIAQFFQVLDTAPNYRLKTLDEDLASFPYVNGKLFEEALPITAFNSTMRSLLLECCYLDWGQISPAIFGSMFQSVMDPSERRTLGAHYTSEKNILKLIKPLFLDELHQEFETIKSNKNKLRQFHEKLSSLKFLDPACGCGNFLIITYRELRLLELEVLKKLYGTQQVTFLDELMKVDVDQFYGIEYDEFPARIAEVALWLTDHQMNLLVSEAFGLYYARLPLKKSAKIILGNALRIDWEEVVSKEDLSFIIGNPPFVGAAFKNKDQTEDMNQVFGDFNHGKLDYVAAWYFLGAKYLQNSNVQMALVSTNSICQGEQVAILWEEMVSSFGIKINFAHRTFNWRNDAKGKAAVHCVIIGFATFNKTKILFDYQDINGQPSELNVSRINAYLVSAEDAYITKRREPICGNKKMIRGNIPYDDGNLLFTKEERDRLILTYPRIAPLIKRYGGSYEMLNNKWRYCLWLNDASIDSIKSCEEVMLRIMKCKEFRSSSSSKSVNSKASTPSLFGDIRQPESDYLLVPRVSSHKRKYLPIGFIDKETILADSAYGLPNASLFEFGIIQSLMHNSWLRLVAGRLKSDFRYSNNIVFNNFPWPYAPKTSHISLVQEKAQKVLDIRAEYSDYSLADLYHPLTMPPKLVKAHEELDKAVDLCYRPKSFKSEASRVEYLFKLYEQYTKPLLNS